MAPLSKSVSASAQQAIKRLANPHTIETSDFFEPAMSVRKLFSSLIGAANPDQVAIIPSVSYGMAIAANNTALKPTNQVVMVEQQFPSAIYTWQRACKASGATLRIVKAPKTNGTRAIAWNEALIEAISHDTAVVIVPELHWTDGLRFDLVSISKKAKAVGARLIIDGTQSIGAQPFNIELVRPDALICAGYKWLTGPYGIGVAYFGEAFENGIPLEENWIARKGSDDFSNLVHYQEEYRDGAVRFDVGERSNFVLLPMLEAALTQVLNWSPATISDHTQLLTNQIVPKLEAIECLVDKEPWRTGHLFGIQLPHHANPSRIAAELERSHLSVSLRGDTIRVAPYLYNTAQDMDALVHTLEIALK
ncbi:aminotransferase class V-fold PLP-dependent enzyme [bacterium]|nr:MAG: aminotransferase class V-fold PLP-dependent enzyme [bacterium]